VQHSSLLKSVTFMHVATWNILYVLLNVELRILRQWTTLLSRHRCISNIAHCDRLNTSRSGVRQLTLLMVVHEIFERHLTHCSVVDWTCFYAWHNWSIVISQLSWVEGRRDMSTADADIQSCFRRLWIVDMWTGECWSLQSSICQTSNMTPICYWPGCLSVALSSWHHLCVGFSTARTQMAQSHVCTRWRTSLRGSKGKSNLDPAETWSYRPISNAPVPSCWNGWCQLLTCLMSADLLPPLQSAYCAGHSTESPRQPWPRC